MALSRRIRWLVLAAALALAATALALAGSASARPAGLEAGARGGPELVFDRSGRVVGHLSGSKFIQIGDKLGGSGGGSGQSRFGYAVALSGDGNTMISVSASVGNVRVIVFTRSHGAWVQQAVLAPLDVPPPPATTNLGLSVDGTPSVALSREGNTALVGGVTLSPNAVTAQNPSGLVGSAVWAFARTGTTWKQQGPKLTATSTNGSLGRSFLGSSMALSADGKTALLADDYDNGSKGSVWMYTRSGGVWTQGSMLAGGDPSAYLQGVGLALSGDGRTALVGHLLPGANSSSNRSGVQAFSRSGATWSPQGALTVSGGPDSRIGFALALSGHGSTALLGASQDNAGAGEVWAFTRSGSTWSQQGGPLVPTDPTGAPAFGSAVALSGDGNTALIGGPANGRNRGAAWVFKQSGGVWSQSGARLAGGGAIGFGGFGGSVALSTAGTTAVIAANNDSNLGGRGAIWTFSSAAPTVTAIAPAAGRVAGGTRVHLTGSDFTGATSVSFGSIPATRFGVYSDGRMHAYSPPGRPGKVHITVTGPNGTSLRGPADTFTYRR